MYHIAQCLLLNILVLRESKVQPRVRLRVQSGRNAKAPNLVYLANFVADGMEVPEMFASCGVAIWDL